MIQSPRPPPSHLPSCFRGCSCCLAGITPSFILRRLIDNQPQRRLDSFSQNIVTVARYGSYYPLLRVRSGNGIRAAVGGRSVPIPESLRRRFTEDRTGQRKLKVLYSVSQSIEQFNPPGYRSLFLSTTTCTRIELMCTHPNIHSISPIKHRAQKTRLPFKIRYASVCSTAAVIAASCDCDELYIFSWSFVLVSDPSHSVCIIPCVYIETRSVKCRVVYRKRQNSYAETAIASTGIGTKVRN